MRGVTALPSLVLITSIFLLTRLMRGVTYDKFFFLVRYNISTHTPHARRDVTIIHCVGNPFISTHTPHARRDVTGAEKTLLILISTHTPHARRDLMGLCDNPEWLYFYSHASCEA